MAQAKTGNHVRVNFTGKLDDGTVFASTMNDEPIEFTLGENEVLPAIEDAVEGMEPGETKSVRIAAEDAFAAAIARAAQGSVERRLARAV